MRRRPNKACKKGQLRVKRKGYKRRDGTRVKGTTYCAEDRGAPGRGKKILPGIEEGGLGGPGYLDKSAKQRHAELDRCVKKDGYRTCLGRIMWLERIGKRTFTKEQKQNLRGDRNYVVRTYGGEGSFGPRKKRRNPGCGRGQETSNERVVMTNNKPPKGTLYITWSSIFDSPSVKYDIDKFTEVLEKAGATEVWSEPAFGWSNQPKVVLFRGLSEKKAKQALEKLPQFKRWGVIISDAHEHWKTTRSNPSDGATRLNPDAAAAKARCMRG